MHASGASNLTVEALRATPYPLVSSASIVETRPAPATIAAYGCGPRLSYPGDDILVSLSSERHVAAGQGDCGGLPGAAGEFIMNPGSA